VPVSIKDLIDVKGVHTRHGSAIFEDSVAQADDVLVQRLRAAGAIVVGKSTTPEFGVKGLTDGPSFGVTRNPWNLERTPGGSSGGASAAVAAGLGPLAIGTDGGGSIRIPCSFTGLFGIKPSFGRVPAWPISPYGTVAHVGPITRDVTDAALMLNVLSQPDARDWYALPYEPRDYRAALDFGVQDLRIAYSSNLGYAKVDPEIASIVKEAAAVFADLGAKVEEKHPGFEDAGPIFQAHWFSGAAALIRTVKDKRHVDPGLLEVAKEGEKITAAQLIDAQMKRGVLGMHMNLFHRDFDLLVTPTLAVAAFDVGRECPQTPENKRWTDWTPFTYPFNLTGQPAASIPCGFTKAGLPVGLQIVGPRFADALVFRAARAFESVRPIKLPDLLRLAS